MKLVHIAKKTPSKLTQYVLDAGENKFRCEFYNYSTLQAKQKIHKKYVLNRLKNKTK